MPTSLFRDWNEPQGASRKKKCKFSPKAVILGSQRQMTCYRVSGPLAPILTLNVHDLIENKIMGQASDSEDSVCVETVFDMLEERKGCLRGRLLFK